MEKIQFASVFTNIQQSENNTQFSGFHSIPESARGDLRPEGNGTAQEESLCTGATSALRSARDCEETDQLWCRWTQQVQTDF